MFFSAAITVFHFTNIFHDVKRRRLNIIPVEKVFHGNILYLHARRKKVSISWWLSETEKKIWHGKKHFMYTYVSISIFVGVIQQDDSD